MNGESTSVATPPGPAPARIIRGLTLMLVVLGGVAVGNLYWAQPLLALIAGDLHVFTGTAASLMTATQLGYTVGILLIVPLGDTLNRRRFIPAMPVPLSRSWHVPRCRRSICCWTGSR